MQINHNIRAMVTQHSLFQNNNSMTKSLEKLSTGLRINRAQDDAAGLAMSEQMRGQIRGLGKAKQNAQDGQAALQIAEGALGEITNMLQRQKELAVQSANDTLTSTERKYLDDEFQALTKEIDRIAKTTDYNGKNVLLFDMDANKSFGATKVNPYNKEVSSLEAANVIYKVYGANLNTGSLSTISGTLTQYSTGTSGAAPVTTSLAGVNADGGLNKALSGINAIISSIVTGSSFTIAGVGGADGKKAIFVANGILHEDNIEEVLKAIVSYSSVTVIGVGAKGAGDVISTTTQTIALGGDMIWTGAVNANEVFKQLSASDQKAIKDANAFIKSAQDALYALQAARTGEGNARDGANVAAIDILKSNSVSYGDMSKGTLAGADTGIKIIDDFAKSIGKLAEPGAVPANTTTIAAIAALFNSATGQKAYQQLMQIDTTKMESGTKVDGTTGEAIKSLQKTLSELKEVVKIYNEGATAVGTAASDLLHVTPNYSRGLGGAEASEIKVNYTAIDVKGLGLQAQSIDSQVGATRAIDRLDETLKIVSGNRAAIGTYINRLDYTVNNIASMEYNTQDAESRIRDTNFATETTNFTRNQIMVQSATSMLAQANSLPQSVLGLIG